MRRFGEILRSVPQEDIEKAYRKKREAWKLCSNIDDIRRIYKELIKLNICNSNRILQIYPSSDPVVMEDINGNPALESPDCVRLLKMEEIRGIYDRFGALQWQRAIDQHLEKISYFLKHPEEITNKIIWHFYDADTYPVGDIFDSVPWAEISSIQVYGYDKPSEKDADLIVTVLDDISAFGSSKEEFEENYLLVNGDDKDEYTDFPEEEKSEDIPEAPIPDSIEREFTTSMLQDSYHELQALKKLLQELYREETAGRN